MSKKISVAIATTGVKENDLPVALALYVPSEPSLSNVFTFKHNKPSHPQALAIHKFTQEDCPITLKAQSLAMFDLIAGNDLYCYNAFFALAKLTAALYLEPDEPISGYVFPFAAQWHCSMNMAEAHFAHEREAAIQASAVAQAPKFTEILKRLGLDSKGLYIDDPKEALMQRAILNMQIVDMIEARRNALLTQLIL